MNRFFHNRRSLVDNENTTGSESRLKPILAGVIAVVAMLAVNHDRAHAQVSRPTTQPPTGTLPRAYPQMPIPKRTADEVLRSKVLQYAIDNMGKQIGGGECTHLVNAALNYAGAKQIEIRKTTAEDLKRGYAEKYGVYTWGTKALKRLGKAGNPVFPAQSGMILQFENCKFEKPDRSAWWTMEHHTAIVKSVKGTVVTLIHQNAPIGGPVSEQTLDMTWVKPLDTSKPYVIDRFYPVKK